VRSRCRHRNGDESRRWRHGDCSPGPATATPATAQVPQGNRSGLTLTTLDNQSAYKRSQEAIGKPVGDHVLLDRQGRPKRLADYKGKPCW
jgi:hypothetical protein